LSELALYAQDGDYSGSFKLDLSTGQFSANLELFFDSPGINEFLMNLETTYNTLSGEAILGNKYEEPFLRFVSRGLGHFTIEGIVLSGMSMHNLALELTKWLGTLMHFVSERVCSSAPRCAFMFRHYK
jgi:hypothetical protein